MLSFFFALCFNIAQSLLFPFRWEGSDMRPLNDPRQTGQAINLIKELTWYFILEIQL